jgi:acyl carrier protein
LEREKFYELFENYIRRTNEDGKIDVLAEKDHLFELGYTDSLGMINMIMFLEETLGEEISLEKYELRNFYTMYDIYNTFFLEKIS